MPKSVRFHKLGGPENLVLEDLPSREPGEGEARIRVQAVGLNRAESMFYNGYYMEQPALPSRLCYEAAGVVEAVGSGVDSSWVGKKIATIPGFSMSRNGVLGEEAVVPASSMAEYPARLSPTEAAAIWMQYLTAYGALMTFGHLAAGEVVLITAASSSVGLAAIQIVKAEGGTAIATTRKSNKKAELISLGADHVIATDEEDLPKRVGEITGGKGARIIFDPIGGPLVEQLAASAARGGILFEYGLLSMQPTPFPLFAALRNGLWMRGYSLMEIRQDPTMLNPARQYVYDRLQDRRFQPKIAKTFPLAQSVDAYKYLESNAQVGKIVITV
ncbi:MAG TPA: zinc-dependent alcohol dehydrogenase family protein [Bryobacteraceae bacterium]|jgi:NADPH:quinone reductase-like Zn-dependent oxidoreductase|nr:zinc-dependent alcohol dehydrogenase family protein [Bryobacteraceae bacterium]